MLLLNTAKKRLQDSIKSQEKESVQFNFKAQPREHDTFFKDSSFSQSSQDHFIVGKFLIIHNTRNLIKKNACFLSLADVDHLSAAVNAVHLPPPQN